VSPEEAERGKGVGTLAKKGESQLSRVEKLPEEGGMGIIEQ